MAEKLVYSFNEKFEGNPDLKKSVLGGKGANLAEMTNLGILVPQGFTVTTETCGLYFENNNTLPPNFHQEVDSHLKDLEKISGKNFGDPKNPLLVSVRSGAKISMPGMMDTILNLGLNEDTVKGLAELTKNEKFAYDSFRRFIQMFGNIALGIPLSKFEELLKAKKKEVGAKEDISLSSEDLQDLISSYKKIYETFVGKSFPSDPHEQLETAIGAVFKSWNNKRAIDYRNHEGIPHGIFTAVNVQTMAFGNMGSDSGTGVAFTRNPATGANEIFGEYLINAQGEDVVAGIRTPKPISTLKDEMPEIYKQFQEICKKLENHYKDMQDVEFTIEKGKLYMLQTRNGKRTGVASAKIAHNLHSEGLIDKATAILRIQPRDVENALYPSITWLNQKTKSYADIKDINEQLKTKSLQELIENAPTAIANKVGEGLPAGPGAASGHIVFDSDLAGEIANGKKEAPFKVTLKNNKGKPKLILCKPETSPEDFHGMVASEGIVTMTGGMTSHAALVARQIGKRCIVGAASSGLSVTKDVLSAKDGKKLKTGDIISVDIISGETGAVFLGELPIFTPTKLPEELETILDWADEIAKIKVRANADKRSDTQMAMDFKATGTGLARTEHQFFDVLETVQGMILAENPEARKPFIEEMKNFQKKDFIDLFQTAKGKPVTIRLIDPPLHEFLPKELELREKIWNNSASDHDKTVLRKVLEYQESNPMLGLRGVRLGLLIPELIEMQTSAILEAAIEVQNQGITVIPEIMIPLVGFNNEFQRARTIVDSTAEKVFTVTGKKIDYKVGTMIEIPRAALTADEIAGGEKGAEFFSFGTNDLHQMTLGFSRDDVAKFLPFYLEEKIIPVDPFQTIDFEGTGILMKMCVEKGRKAAEKEGRYLKCSICGEHGGDPASIDFCYKIGLDTVSCSPFRVPVARLACAHSTLNNPEPDKKYGKKYPIPI
ncbi:MAG: Pyruvate, phosphate dikinase [Candidatus Heimdallarchaeota archaeon LC_3]|nr:MAG: Pyruvate, phosphate dikinase [Candidatus Heimdallarchaeota archaeon LC_3]